MKDITTSQIIVTKDFGFIAKGTVLNVTIKQDSQGRDLVLINNIDIPWGTINPSPLQVDNGVIRHSRFAFA